MIDRINHQSFNRGFSLIEIMVVVVIIGIFASYSILKFNPDDSAGKLKQESLRFQRVFSIALDEAQIHGTEFGLIITEKGYQFLLLKDQSWQPVTADRPLETHHWPEDTKVFLTLEGLSSSDNEQAQKFSLSNSFNEKQDRDIERESGFGEDLSFSLEDDNEDEESSKVRPQIYLLSSGETTPFNLLLLLEGNEKETYFQISANYVGHIEISGPFAEEPEGDFYYE